MGKRSVSLKLTATPQTIMSGAFLMFFGMLVLGGGSARPDIIALVPIRVAAVMLIALVLLVTPADRLSRARMTLGFFAICFALVALQLVPLPPSLWQSLPGRARFAFDSQAGLGAVWRPFSLTPDLTINTLLALLAPAAGALWMRVSGYAGRTIALYVIAGTGLATAALGLLQIVAGADTPLRYYPITNTDSAVGLFANRNHNAMMLGVAVPLLALWAGLAGCVDRRDGIIRGWLALGGTVFLTAMAAVTGSRGGLVLALGSVGFAALLGWQLRRTWPKSRRGDLTSAPAKWLPVAVVAITVVLAALLSRSPAVSRLLATDPLDEQRALWLKPLTEMAWSFAPAGAGFGAFDSIFRGFEPFALLQTTYLNAAHNDLLQLAIEGGAGGLGVLAIYLFWWTRRTFAVWRTPISGSAIAFARAASIMTGTMLIASLFDYPLRTPIHAVVFAIASVWLWTDNAGADRSKAPLPPSRD